MDLTGLVVSNNSITVRYLIDIYVPWLSLSSYLAEKNMFSVQTLNQMLSVQMLEATFNFTKPHTDLRKCLYVKLRQNYLVRIP